MIEVISKDTVGAAVEEKRPLYVPYSSGLLMFANNVSRLAIDAHSQLYGGDRTLVIEDGDDGTPEKYVTMSGEDGRPCWADNVGDRYGIRGVNLNSLAAAVNRTTVLHVPINLDGSLPDKLDIHPVFSEMSKMGKYVFDSYAEPYLRAVAEIYGIDPQDYISKFIVDKAGPVMRVIMYHSNDGTCSELVPRSTDGRNLPLAIKEHNDKGAFTVDAYTTHGGLEYMEDGAWRAAREQSVAIFPSAGDQHMDPNLEPVTHRVTYSERWSPISQPIGNIPGIVRLAIPLFIDSVVTGARTVEPGSVHTHPTYQS